jgi:hypothetical protein
MKRKASALEEPSHAFERAHWDNSTTSTASPESIKASHNQWNTPAIPYLSSRTRKRYRDNRPDTDSVHQDTLAKLYNAQRQIHTEEIAEQRRSEHVGSYLMSLDIPEQIPPSQASTEPKQRSIDAFFGNNLMSARQPKPQPSYIFTSLVAPDSCSLNCEDCGSHLQGDTVMDGMDIDLSHSDWCCARCARKVCDMCAVRGDSRICLECSIPGRGT